MAEEEHSSGSPFALLWFFIFALGFLVLIWLMRHDIRTARVGGLFINSPLATSSSFLPAAPAVPIPTAQGGANTYSYPLSSPALTHFPRSPYYGSVIIQDYSGAKSSNPDREYVTLYAASAQPVVISGWRIISSSSGRGATIGGGVLTPHLGSAMSTGAIELFPGQSAAVVTGRSPVGVSFRENECVGYLSQFQQFTPPLLQSCPYPVQELYNSPVAQDASCVAAMNQYPSCHTPTSAPAGVSPSCSAFITNRLTYNGCVNAHQGDANFEGNNWRIYLNQSQELWNNQSDVIAVLDNQGRLVAAISY